MKKKLFTYFNILALSSLIFASCNNDMPTFNDNDAFVAFDKISVAINEDAGTVSIPLTLASLSGKESTVTVEATDGTAKQGINYTLSQSSVNFTKDGAQQNLVITIINQPGVYTGDLKFSVTIKDAGSVNAGNTNTCTVTINDLDHPLTPILGTYTASGKSGFNGPVTWDVTLMKDPTDITKVWICELCYGFAQYGFTYPSVDTRYYGIVNDDLTEISIPAGQSCTYKYKDGDIVLYGITPDIDVIDEGTIVAKIQDGGKTIVFDELGFAAADPTGYWDYMAPVISLTKAK